MRSLRVSLHDLDFIHVFHCMGGGEGSEEGKGGDLHGAVVCCCVLLSVRIVINHDDGGGGERARAELA